MDYLGASGRALVAAAAALALAGCDIRSADSSKAPAAAGKEAGRQAPAQARTTPTGYADVEGGESTMRKIIGSVFVSLDGVMQSPGDPDEDRSGDFKLGGWLPTFGDDAVGQRVENLFTPPFDLLLGRRTYDIFAAYWPYATGEWKALGERFDCAAKYVVTGGGQRLDWQNSHRLENIDAIAALKRGEGPDLIIQGSGTLYPQLLRAGLLDRLTLMIFPVILGSGKRLFGDGTPPGAMRMVEHQITPSGNVIATYQPDGAVETSTFQARDPSAAELDRRGKVEAGTW